MAEVCPGAILLQYVNPMAINTWAIAAKYPSISQVGLCHSVQGTAAELAHDLDLPVEEIRYRAAGINHMAFYLSFEHGSRTDRTDLPGAPPGLPRGPHPEAVELESALPEQGALRDADAARLLRHRELGALRRVHALVHQARPARPDRAVRHPARRVPQALRRADRPVEAAGRGLPQGRHDRGGAEPRVRERDRQRGGDRRAVGHLRQLRQPGLHPAAPRRLRRRGADAGRRERPAADHRRATSRRS